LSNTLPVYALLITNKDGSGTGYRCTSGRTLNGGLFDAASPLLLPGSISRTCDPREARFNTSTLGVQLLDINGEITAIISTLAGKLATLYSVEFGANFSTKRTIFVGVIQEFSQTENGYGLSIASPIVLADKTLFDGAKSQLSFSIGSGDTSAIIDDASGGVQGFQDTGFVLIDSERIAYATCIFGGSTWTLGGLTRGVNGSSAASHAAHAVVEELFILGPAHPYDILADIFSDPASSKTGLGMADFIDTANFAAAKSAIGSTLEMSFEITTGENAKAWMENEIFRATGAYPFESNAGLISIKAFATVGGTSGAVSDADTLGWAQWLGNYPKRVNSVTIRYDYNLQTDKFEKTFTYRDNGLFVLDGDFPLLIDSKGIHSALTDTDLLLANRTLAYVARFGLQLPTIGMQTFFSKNTLSVADDITATFRRLVNVTTGTIGLTSAASEIISLVMQLQSGSMMQFEIFMHPPTFETLVPDGEPGIASEEAALSLVSAPTLVTA
jgi:hypothetical protein